ncbi:MAG TPA: hypothetical protein VK498_16100 [Ferruginibacter sp.]|nr:hypothetical protein [Ferruginibacter sp.]
MTFKQIAIVTGVLFISCNDANNKDVVTKTDSSLTTNAYSKNDLSTASWIEGKWKGMYKGKPFYEIYEIINDSLKITSYEWDGKDSSNSSVDYLKWDGDAFYLGKENNYRVMLLSDSVIKMVPVKANNDVTWRKTNTGWDATLVGKKETNVYNMEHFDPFK